MLTAPDARPRVSIVDDATAVRAALPALMPGIGFVSSHANVEDLLAQEPPAEVVIVDLHLTNHRQPDVRQGLAAVAAVVDAGYRVCVYTQEERRFVLASCLAAGAMGVVSKAVPLDVAQADLLAVAAGELTAPPAVVAILDVLGRRQHLTLLTGRQRQIINGRARGLTYAELARELHVAPSTLRGYWREITEIVARHLAVTSPGDIERALGLGPGDLVGVWPDARPGAGPDRGR